MSHQTGIRPNEKLKKFFAKCHSGKIRLFKVTIENEELSLSAQIDSKGTWEDDFEKNIKKLVQEDQPCYIMSRFDSKNANGGYDWLLISWSPDDSPVRQKMLYASTKATLKQEFGSGQITQELHATAPEDLSVVGIRKQKDAPAPLSPAEEEAKMSQLSDAMRLVGVETKGSTLSSLTMPLVEAAKESLVSLATSADVNYVRLLIDIPNERVDVDLTAKVCGKELGSYVPEDTARYHVIRFEYEHENVHKKAFIFIYSMPGYSCPIKERMLYSSSKGPLIETVESILGAKIDKKMEVDSGKEVTEECLIDALHPAPLDAASGVAAKKFDKPKGPARGAKRMTKPVCSLLE
ncbi:Twinfilin-1 [Nesidiocoris tenuis]|uniref:Twinfilin-1 n=1 Tax=Nesidiocoris tenuis TaxID=355587 RepID=A0ABN7BGW5_9HEMI|nr:Twinfilin-1 [Nesidiocoris tenuis]